MINGLLPLSSLKRDEIYTFIAGLYVAVIWYLFLGSMFYKLYNNSITLYNSCIFITTWLTSTVLLFVIQLYLSSLMRNSLQKYCNNAKHDIMLKALSLDNSRLNYVTTDYYKELIVYIHIIGLSMSSGILIAYPSMTLLSYSIKYMSIFFIALVILILLLFYQYHKFWLCLCCYISLRRNGRIEVYDEKKYSEEMALALSKDNIIFNRDMDTLNRNSGMLQHIHILKHSFSFIENSEQLDGTVEWKWQSIIKINKSINKVHLNKYAYIEYSLFDSDKLLLAKNDVSFDDNNKITIEPIIDDDISISKNDAILTCREMSSITVAYAKRVSMSNCKIKFKLGINDV